jgi:hypothetical protein
MSFHLDGDMTLNASQERRSQQDFTRLCSIQVRIATVASCFEIRDDLLIVL